MEASSPTSNGGLEAWPSLAVSAAATVLLLAFYAWAASRRLGAGKRLRKFTIRVAALTDADAVITDAARTPQFYARAGLPSNESSLHLRQDDGFVHALDLRTINRPEWRNLLAELAFRAMGFHTLRHVGTADHLHVSLRLAR